MEAFIGFLAACSRFPTMDERHDMKWFVTGLMVAGVSLWYVMNTRIQKLEGRVLFIETRVMAELTEQDRRVQQMLDWMDELNSNRTYIINGVPETDFEITIHGKKKHE